MVAYFQSVIGEETDRQFRVFFNNAPDLIIACVGGGSNAIGIFTAFLKQNTRLVVLKLEAQAVILINTLLDLTVAVLAFYTDA